MRTHWRSRQIRPISAQPRTWMVVSLVTVMVRQTEGEEKQQLMIMMHTFEGLVIPAGMQMKIDENEPVKLPFVVCFPSGCQVQTDLTPEMLESIRKGGKQLLKGLRRPVRHARILVQRASET